MVSITWGRLARAGRQLLRHPWRTSRRLARAARRRLGRAALARAAVPAGALAARLPADPAREGPVLSEHLPVFAYLALGFDHDQLRALARAVQQVRLVRGDHVPLIVTDSPAFSQIRDTRVAVEYLPDRHTWQRHRDDVSWESFRSRRLALLLRLHRPERTVLVDPSGPVDLPRLLELV